MKHKIDSTDFGGITVDGETYGHDIMIRLSGKIKKRDKELSKKKRYGSLHLLSPEEAEEVHEKGCGKLIIGTGQYNNAPSPSIHFTSKSTNSPTGVVSSFVGS